MRQAMTTKCDRCGKAVKVYGRKAQAMKHHFCCQECAREFTSQRMTDMNRELNPERMTDETREKLRHQRLNTGNGIAYEKTYGRHTHRVIAEQILGRPLKPSEVVHHIDRNKRNNDPSNLMIFESQAEHAKWHKEHDIQSA